MNQILYTEKDFEKKSFKNKKKLKKFKIQFFISLLLILCSVLYFLYFEYNKNIKEKLSKTLLSNFNLERIYSNNKDYITVKLNESGDFFVVGIIEIPKINIKYPILSDTNDDFLKLSPCRFYGPYPNEVGNLCIAAHNYDDNRFFSNIHKLSIGDSINIYDSNNQKIVYYTYDKFEIVGNDTSCTNQDTNGKKEITLVTCNNINKNRLVIKAKEESS